MTVTPQGFIQGMRQLAAGVTLITSAHGGRRSGLTATAVCSVSAEPPQLLVCINQRAETYVTVQRSGAFAVNLLASDQHRLAEIFAGAGGNLRRSALRSGALDHTRHRRAGTRHLRRELRLPPRPVRAGLDPYDLHRPGRSCPARTGPRAAGLRRGRLRSGRAADDPGRVRRLAPRLPRSDGATTIGGPSAGTGGRT